MDTETPTKRASPQQLFDLLQGEISTIPQAAQILPNPNVISVVNFRDLNTSESHPSVRVTYDPDTLPANFDPQTCQQQIYLILSRAYGEVVVSVVKDSNKYQESLRRATTPEGRPSKKLRQIGEIPDKYTFDKFITPPNIFPLYNARAVVDSVVGDGFNQWLCFVGPNGTGKTHLLGAIGNALRQQERAVVSLDADDLSSLAVQCYHEKRKVPVWEYRGGDLLLVDSLHTLDGGARKGTEGNLYTIFEDYLRRDKPVIMAMTVSSKDKFPPKPMVLVNKDLASRLSRATQIPVQLPGRHMKGLIKGLFKVLGTTQINEEELEETAQHLSTLLPLEATIRQAESYVNNLLTCANHLQTPVTPQLAYQLFGQTYLPGFEPRGAGDIEEILSFVSQACNVPSSQITGDTRAKEVVAARDLVAFLASKSGLTCSKIGRALGGKVHSSIAVSIRRAGKKFTEEQLNHALGQLRIPP